MTTRIRISETNKAQNTRFDDTCEMIQVLLYDEEGVEGIQCTKCEWADIHDWGDPMPDRCPNCKSKVVSK